MDAAEPEFGFVTKNTFAKFVKGDLWASSYLDEGTSTPGNYLDFKMNIIWSDFSRCWIGKVSAFRLENNFRFLTERLVNWSD